MLVACSFRAWLLLKVRGLKVRGRIRILCANSQMSSGIVVPPEAQPSPNFNVDAATDAYLAQIRPRLGRARTHISKAGIG